MNILEKFLIQYAIELSSIIGDHTETIFNLTKSFIETEFGLYLRDGDIKEGLKESAVARLFFACAKTKPGEIKKPQNCLRLVRNLWIAHYISGLSETDFTEENCCNEITLIFKKEKQCAGALKLEHSPLIDMIKNLFDNKRNALEYQKYIKGTAKYHKAAFYVLSEYFLNTSVKDIFDIYNPFFEPVQCNILNESKVNDNQDKMKIKYLEKTIHELKVKLEHSQKDAIREIILTLVSIGYGAPLFELNSIKKDDTTPENITSVISNLFLALESFDIRVSKENMVGKQVKASEIEEGKFYVQNAESIEKEDTMIVKYPGIKLGKEMIVKPTIVKED